jgi:elongation factor G
MSANEIHNISFLGYSDAGKTTLVEAVAHHFKAIPRMGTVAEGTTLCDFTQEEKDKKHSLAGSVVHLEAPHGILNLVDTPGYPDFVADAITSMGAAGTAVFVIAARETGVPFHTLQLWRLAGQAGLARAVVVTKLDGDNLDGEQVLAQIRDTLGNRVVPFTEPLGTGTNFTGVEVVANQNNPHRSELVDAIVESDDDLMEKYLDDGEISESALEAAIPNAMAKGTFAPLFCVNPITGVGMDEFSEFLVRDFPSASMQLAAMHSENVEDGSAKGRVVARAWKVLTDKHLGQVTYLRILQGTLTADVPLQSSEGGKPIKANGMSMIVGKDLKNVQSAGPGDIVAITRVEEIGVGDVLVSEGSSIHHQFPLPEPYFSLAVRPESRADEQKISSELHKAAKEDPTFRVRRDDTTHEMIVDGLGEMHLTMVLHKVESRGVKTETSLPRIAYKETVVQAAEGHHRHKKQSGGSGQFGECYLRLAPTARGEGFRFVDKIVGGSIPRQFIPAVEKGIHEQMVKGIIAGSEVVDIEVQLYDGKFHAVDSDEVSFKMAGARALRNAFEKAKPIILEPIMDVDITVPGRFFGDVSGDLNNRRGQILGMDSEGDFQILKAQVPLAELQTYGTSLRSMTHGEGDFAMSFNHYHPLPSHLQEKIVSELGEKEDS